MHALPNIIGPKDHTKYKSFRSQKQKQKSTNKAHAKRAYANRDYYFILKSVAATIEIKKLIKIAIIPNTPSCQNALRSLTN